MGPGGVGKSALAGAVPGARWIDLSPAVSADDVAAAVASALGGADAVSRSVDELLAATGSTAIVFDGAEHVIEALIELLVKARSPSARWIVTSRRELASDELRVLRVPPLGVDPAGTLFVQRGAAVQPAAIDMTSARDAALVTRIVQQLEGLPLAIEIAASKLRVLSLGQLAERLDDALRFVDRGRADRHRSLSAVLEWSWSLLSRPTQQCASLLSTLRGRFTIDDAEQLLPDEDPLEVVEDLYRDGWLTGDGNDVRGYRFFELSRRFLRDKLAGDRADADDRHARFALARARDTMRTWERGATDSLRSAMLDQIFDVSAALDHVAHGSDHEAAADLAVALATTYSQIGQMGRGLAVLEATWRRSGPHLEPAPRGRLRWHLEMFASQLGGAPVTTGDVTVEAALAEGFAMTQVQAVAAMSVGDHRAALAHLERAEVQAAETRNNVGRAFCLLIRCLLEPLAGRFAAYHQYMTPALELLRAAGARQVEGYAWNYFAAGHVLAGKYQEALRCNDNALKILGDVGNPYFVAIARFTRGWAQLGIGDLAAAEATTREAVAGCRAGASPRGVSWCQYQLGVILLLQGRDAEALLELDQAIARFRADASNPFLALAHSRRAVALARLARLAEADEAIAAARDALARCTEFPFELGLALDAANVSHGSPEQLLAAARASGLDHYDHIRTSLRLFKPTPAARQRLVASDGFREVTTPGGSVIRLGRQAASRRMLIAMADAKRALSVAELFEAGWPDDQITPTSAARRVYSAIYLLRRRGLDPWIEHDGDGYRFTADIERRR